MKAVDIMTRSVQTLSPEELIGDALEHFAAERFQALPVVDGAGRLAGMLCLPALLAKILPRYIVDGELGDVSYAPDLNQIHQRLDSLRGQPVSSVMDRHPPTVTPDSSALACGALLHKVHAQSPILPVVDAAGALVGVVASWDLLKQIERPAS